MKIGIIGAGMMGRQIATVCLLNDHVVTIQDIDDNQLESAVTEISDKLTVHKNREDGFKSENSARDRIVATTALDEAVDETDLVIEAVPENLELKRDIFDRIEPSVSSDTIIATNTSSLPVTQILEVLDEPSRGLGLHFFSPVLQKPLLELVVADQTSAETEQIGREFTITLDKEPIVIEDWPGFASSRLGLIQAIEAIRMVQEGVAKPRSIDRVMELGYAHETGPLELTDYVGLDLRLEIAKYFHQELGERYRPPQLLKQKVRAGKLGRKTGEGFYIWDDDEIVGESDR